MVVMFGSLIWYIIGSGGVYNHEKVVLQLCNLRNCNISEVKQISFIDMYVYWLIVNLKNKIRITKNDT